MAIYPVVAKVFVLDIHAPHSMAVNSETNRLAMTHTHTYGGGIYVREM